MLAETTEFQISQYLDGTLSAAEQSAVESMLASNADARKVLADYRRLNQQLVSTNAGPSVNWNSLSGHISGSIEQQADRPLVAGRIGFGSTAIKIAAALLLTVGTALVARHYAVRPAVAAPKAIAGEDVAVSGPSAEPPAGPASVDVSVAPSVTAMRNDPARYGEANRPSRVVISRVPTGKNDSH
jgi:anti-sigma factor RsiW